MKTKKILISLILGLFVFSNTSCAQQTGQEAPAPKPQTAATAELVYLKVENAVASSFDETPDWAPRPDAMAPVDGNIDTRWSSAYKDNEWIYFDFGKEKTLSRVVIKWEQAYATDYEISVSSDAKDWKRIASRVSQPGGTAEIEFEPVRARYVKLLGLKRINPEWGMSMWEFEPYGPKNANPDELPIEKIFAAKGEKTEAEKKLEVLKAAIDTQPAKSPGPLTKDEFQRGINYTSWDRLELMANFSDLSLIHLSELGVGHIALMVVYYQDDAASKRIYIDEKKTIDDEALSHAINMIHALGMKVMLKPHVDLQDEDARTNILPSEEWFANYKSIILQCAQLASKHDVELFCIGTELSNTTISTWKKHWLDIIKDIRAVYKAPITYAANWDEYETVSFWNEVDFIGMDAYFPLTDKNNPPKDELIAAWNKHADTLEKWLKDSKLDKPIIFTEIGYDTIEGSNKQPWRVLPTLTKYKESQEEQANCLESLLTVFSKRPWFKGLYWWNYFPRPDIGPLGYTLRGKLGEKVLSEWYKRLK